jgi:hypothetical protein
MSIETLNKRILHLISTGVKHEDFFLQLSTQCIKDSVKRLNIVKTCKKCLMGKHGQSSIIEYWYYKYNGTLYGFCMNISTKEVYGLHLL